MIIYLMSITTGPIQFKIDMRTRCLGESYWLHETIAYWPVVHCALWSVTKIFKWNIGWLAKYHKINYTAIACGERDRLLCWPYTPAEVSHQRWIVYHVCLCKVWIRQNPLWLWNPEETSPEVRNRGISGPKNGHVSNKNLKKNEKKLYCNWWQ